MRALTRKFLPIFLPGLLFAALLHAGPYPGTIKPHGHTGPGDGGFIGSLAHPPTISPYTYGIKGDGSTDDSTALQTMFTAISASSVTSHVDFPNVTIKVNNTLTVDGTVTSIKCNGTKFDFSGLNVSSVAFVFTGFARNYAGQPYLSVTDSMEGCEIVGPSPNGTGGGKSIGIFVGAPSDPGSAHYLFKDNAIYSFNWDAWISSNSYLVDFIHNNMFVSGGCLRVDNTPNSGERDLLADGACFNVSTGVWMSNGNADVYIRNMSMDGINAVGIYQTNGGGITATGSHFESNYAPSYTNALIYLSTGGNTNMMNFDSDWFLIKSTHSVPAFWLQQTCNFRMMNSYINGTASVSSNTIQSDMVGGSITVGPGVVSTMNDPFFVNNSGSNYTNWNDQSNNIDIGRPINEKGTILADNAPAGYKGQRIDGVCAIGSPVTAAATTVLFDLTNIIISSGDWEINGMICQKLNGATETNYSIGVGHASGSGSSGYSQGLTAAAHTELPNAGSDACNQLPVYRESVASNTTLFLKSFVTYSAGSPQAYGEIHAVRAR